MDEGICDIRLVPSWSNSSVLRDLKAALSKAQLLQAGIAYWTVNDTLLGADLARTLAAEGAFLCVDLHPPTEIDALAALVRKGAHVYLYCEEIPTVTDSGRQEPSYLLHTKMLFFWSPDRTVELWVGSHNWTNRAIVGLNFEASVVIKARDSATVCLDAAQYLEEIRQSSLEFDLSKLDFYKQAQRNMRQRTKPVIELEGRRADTLSNITFGFFGSDAGELEDLPAPTGDLYVSVLDSDTEEEYLYPASILQSGLLTAAHRSAGGISFSPRRYAFRPGRKFPVLQPEGPVEHEILDRAQFFATLNLQNLDRSIVAEVVPPKMAVWSDLSPGQSPALSRLDSQARAFLFRGRSAQPRTPRSQQGSAQALTLLERRDTAEVPFITRRIIRPKG